MAYGLACYVVFLGAFLYAIGFVGGLVVPKSVNTPLTDAAWPRALIQDAVLLLLFAVAAAAYCLVARQFEERYLLHFYGEQYAGYRRQGRMLVAIPRRVRNRP